MRFSLLGILLAAVLTVSAAHARTHDHGAAADSASHDSTAAGDMSGMDMSGMDMSGMDMSDHMAMTGLLGPYPMSREASGTSWQPDGAEHHGIHAMAGDWMLMLHGSADLVHDHQGGPRGDDRFFSDNWVMGMASRTRGAGTLGLRAMVSLEPLTIGKQGYPLLLQTGETADGVTPLIDRQHPHDFVMELAGSYSVSSGNRSLFVYGGLPGEPALGPPAYMHRFAGMVLPEAPITHHWLDSSHVTFGVLTGGAVLDRVKVEVSAFRGREPDQNRWDIETPKLDSHAFRLSVNPTRRWSLQVSHGRITSPEQLEPGVDVDRTTASVMYDGTWTRGSWEGTAGWGRNVNRPGHTLDGYVIEAAARIRDRHVVFARGERVEKDELFYEGGSLPPGVLSVSKLSLGYRIDVLAGDHFAAGLGAVGSAFRLPGAARDAYGDSPLSALLFVHAELR